MRTLREQLLNERGKHSLHLSSLAFWPFGHATRTATLRERPREEFIVFGFESVELVSRIACFKLTAES
ncbi:MAG: hypothetical protein F6J90_24730 [Moorea sp. SIOASIH]|uniref:hypothetical protein n=1 Tax=Moorena sp. SIOASIH TaxID=2607817 RepID=UPI0013BCF61A|nr:hypothetical protein [Moorena sp. SIOASIH]NEO39364.1 hypothetical protein [Moorena sp. SIOASIH]